MPKALTAAAWSLPKRQRLKDKQTSSGTKPDHFDPFQVHGTDNKERLKQSQNRHQPPDDTSAASSGIRTKSSLPQK